MFGKDFQAKCSIGGNNISGCIVFMLKLLSESYNYTYKQNKSVAEHLIVKSLIIYDVLGVFCCSA